MTAVFADTSAFFALGCAADQAHHVARKAWRGLRDRDVERVTEGIEEIFAFDRHFTDEGFSPVR